MPRSFLGLGNVAAHIAHIRALEQRLLDLEAEFSLQTNVKNYWKEIAQDKAAVEIHNLKLKRKLRTAARIIAAQKAELEARK